MRFLILTGLIYGGYALYNKYQDHMNEFANDKVKIQQFKSDKIKEIKDTKKLNKESHDFTKKWEIKKNNLIKEEKHEEQKIQKPVIIDSDIGEHTISI